MNEQKASVLIVCESDVVRKAVRVFFECHADKLAGRDVIIEPCKPQDGNFGRVFQVGGAAESASRIRLGRLLDEVLKAVAMKIVTFGGYDLDIEQSFLQKGEVRIDLTDKEVALLLVLYKSGGALERSVLLKDVWDYAETLETHTLETHIYRLRQKIEQDPTNPALLVTDGEGYRLVID